MDDKTILINDDIPGYIKIHDLKILGQITRKLSENSTLIDVGCGWGREAWVFSKNSPASSKIYCLDIWGWKPTWKYMHGDDKKLVNSQEEFEVYMRDCQNCVPVLVKKNESWNKQKADFIFYDEEDEENDIIYPKLLHWLNMLKPEGILCGTDYYPESYPQVKKGLAIALRRVAAELDLTFIHHASSSIWMLAFRDNFMKWRR